MKNIKLMPRYEYKKEQQDVFPQPDDPRDIAIQQMVDKINELAEAVNYLINNK